MLCSPPAVPGENLLFLLIGQEQGKPLEMG